MLRLLNKLDQLFVYIASFALFIMMLLIFTNVITRYFFDKPIAGVIEFTGEYLMVFVVFLAMSFTQKEGGHVKVTILERMLPDKGKFILDLLVKILSVSIFLVLTYTSFLLFTRHLNQDIRSISSVAYPLAPAVFVISLGSFVMSLRLILSLFISSKDTKEQVKG
ncbi:TRAP transporter small permease [Mesobacillus maritimus]|uniref:TRAP transporter small permease n=1 Tax=Mesobacillus maritimus TaxID=1643336 RepID=UPI00384CEE2C